MASKYVEVSIHVSEGKVRKIKNSMEKDKAVTIRLCAADLVSQASKIAKCKEEIKGMDLKMSKTQVKANVKIGGFL